MSALATAREHLDALVAEQHALPAALERERLQRLDAQIAAAHAEVAVLEAEAARVAEGARIAHLKEEETRIDREEIAADHEMDEAEVTLARLAGRKRRMIERRAEVRAQLSGDAGARTTVVMAEGERAARRLLVLGGLLAEVVGRPASASLAVDILRQVRDGIPRAAWLEAALGAGAGT